MVLNGKTLAENVNEVVNAKLSNATKKRVLVEVVGLTKNEANWIVNTKCAPTPSTPRFKFKFGVEIEMLVNRDRVQRLMNEGGVSYRWQGYYTHTNGNSTFDFKSDSSIHGDSHTESGNSGIECVSPVLDGNKGGREALKKACDAIESAGAQVNRSTGLHIHISTEGMNGEWFVNVFKNYQKLEGVIDTFMARSRRANNTGYAQSLAGFDFSDCHSADDVVAKLNSRFYKVNPFAYGVHRTIEFRQHQGSTNYEKINNWLSFVSKLVQWSKSNVLTENVTSIADIKFLTASEKSFFEGRAQQFAEMGF